MSRFQFPVRLGDAHFRGLLSTGPRGDRPPRISNVGEAFYLLSPKERVHWCGRQHIADKAGQYTDPRVIFLGEPRAWG